MTPGHGEQLVNIQPVRRGLARIIADRADQMRDLIGGLPDEDRVEPEAESAALGAAREAADVFALDELRIDKSRRRATVRGRPVRLTLTEFDLLAVLASEAGRVVPNERLLERVWTPDKPGNLQTLRTHLTRLRRKLGEDSNYIVNQRGVGYRLGPAAPDEPRPAQ